MAQVVRPEFRSPNDYRDVVRRTMQSAWLTSRGHPTIEQWAEQIGVSVVAAKAYLDGINVPAVDTVLRAMEGAGWPACLHMEAWAAGQRDLALARRAFKLG